ncbi:hypothetical protein G6L37_02275 [Agrobacterium rubi]|nr:hypothetical protein [Agrobacterium rubi]NTF24221.1 hypothetical protein [Agrobacterium rubi]
MTTNEKAGDDMQIIFMMAFGLLLISVAMVGSNRNEGSVARDAQAAAAHMSVYHSAAVSKCKAVACPTGAVDPGPYLNDVIRSGPLYERGYFQTNYDAPTKTLVTHMKPGFALRGTVNFGTVNAALKDLQDADSSSFGAWDRSSARVIPSYVAGYRVTFTMPSGIRSVLPDRSPVIVSHM